MVQEDEEYGTVADKAVEKKNQTEKKKKLKTTCTEVKVFIQSRAPLLASRASEGVALAGFASSSNSCSAVPQAMLSKKGERASERYRISTTQ